MHNKNGAEWFEAKPADSLKQCEGQDNAYKEEEGNNGDGWQSARRQRNCHKQNNTNGYQPRRGSGSSGYKVDDHLQASRPGNVGGRERNYGWIRGFKRDDGSRREVKVKDKQHQDRQKQERVSDGIVENLTEANSNKDDRENRIRNWSSGGNNRVNRGSYRGYGQGGVGEGKGGAERRGNSSESDHQGYMHAIAAGGKDTRKISESMELLHDEEMHKANAMKDLTEEDRLGFILYVNPFTTIGFARGNATEESKSNEGKHDQRRSQEEAERLQEEESEAKKMTLKQYEKQLQEKRKVLESTNTQERRVTLDKDFESMHIIEKKNVETVSINLNSDSNKQKKKVTMDNDDKVVRKPLVTNFKQAGTNYSGRRGGRNRRHEETWNGYSSGHRESRGHNLGSVKKTTGAPRSFEDAEEFPALALVRSAKV